MSQTSTTIVVLIAAGIFSNVIGTKIATAQHPGLPYSEHVVAYPLPGVTQTFFDHSQPNQVSPVNAVYQAIAPAADPVDELYRDNAKRPLGGLFAKGFTRTATLLGGWNFTNAVDANREFLDPIPGFEIPFPIPIDTQTGYAISFAFGRRHNHRLRSEIELAVRQNDLESDSLSEDPTNLFQASIADGIIADGQDDQVRAYSIMKNFIFEFRNDTRLTPYVGAGLGWSYLDIDAPAAGIEQGVGAFSYQGIGGVATKLNKAVDLIVEYRFLGTSEVELDSVDQSIAYQTHNLFMGLKLEY